MLKHAASFFFFSVGMLAGILVNHMGHVMPDVGGVPDGAIVEHVLTGEMGMVKKHYSSLGDYAVIEPISSRRVALHHWRRCEFRVMQGMTSVDLKNHPLPY